MPQTPGMPQQQTPGMHQQRQPTPATQTTAATPSMHTTAQQQMQSQPTQAAPPLKTLQRSAVSAWCPAQPNLIAMGTSQSATPSINADF
eukprot:g15174.t1